MSNADNCAYCGRVRASDWHRVTSNPGTHAFVEPAPQPAPSGDEAKVRGGALARMANLAWSAIMREKGDIAVVDAVVRDAYATGLRDAALLVEFADLFWHIGDPRTRIATELRKRAADAIRALRGRT